MTIAEVKQKLNKLNDLPRKGVEIMKAHVYDAPIKAESGALRDSIRYYKVGEDEYVIGPFDGVGKPHMSTPEGWEKSFEPFPYGNVVANGRSEISMPRNARYPGNYPLRWYGGKIAAWKVKGTKGNHFDKTTRRELIAYIRSLFK